MLADVAAHLHDDGRPVKLVVCGEGSLADALAQRVQRLGLDGEVEMTGYVPIDAGLGVLYAEADVFLHVSWTEGVPQVILEAFETIYGAEAEDMLRAWGRRATERWLAEGRHGMGGPRWLVPGRQRKLQGIVKSFSEAMDNVRGEHTHAWLQVDEFQFWLVNFSNIFALGRIKTVKSCHVWVATIEAILRWAGLANDWYVEEVECGCVTGTFDCVFAIRSVET